MATVSLFLDKRRVKNDGTYPVKLIIYSDNINKRYSFNKKISLTEKQFDKLCSKGLKNEELQKIKKYADLEVGRAVKVINDLGNDFTFELFESFYLGNKRLVKANQNKVFVIYEEYIESLLTEDRLGSAQCYEYSMRSIRKYSSNLQIKEITPQFLEKYEKWFLDQGNSIATLQGYMYCFRTIINILIRKKLIHPDYYPFGMKKDRKYEIPQPGKVNRALTIQDIRKIKEYECEDDEEFSRDMWLFSFYCNGMNMADIFALKYKDLQDDFFSFHRTKTLRTRKNKIPIEVYLTDNISDIIHKWGNRNRDDENYIFDIYSLSMTEKERHQKKKVALAKINRYTKALGRKLNISIKLTSYAARNSWATIVADEVGGSVREISEGLGHSTLAMTQKYLDAFPKTRKMQTAKTLSSML